MGWTWKLSVTASEGDCRSTKPMVRHTRAMTHIKSRDGICQIKKEAYQPCLEIRIDYD